MAGGGHIIIRNKLRIAAELGAVQEQLGAMKQAKLLAILAKPEADWTPREAVFAARCVADALSAYEE